MKLIRGILILAVSTFVAAQAPPPNRTPSSPPKAAAAATPVTTQTKAAVPADAPVVTVPGVCKSSPASAQDCKIVVTRAQFEALAHALSAARPEGLTPELRGRLASQYGEMLLFATEAENQGLDKDADTQSLLRFARAQVLAQQMLRLMQAKSQPTPQEIQKYYQEHSAEYQRISVQRIMLPSGHKKEGSDVQALANEARKRLVAGEAAAKIEQEMYEKLGFKSQPPETALFLSPSALPPNQQSVAKLKAGEVSEVLSDNSALLIYKSEGQKAIPLEQVQGEIRSTLEQQKVRGAIEALRSNHEPALNGAYFSQAELRGSQPVAPH